MVDRNTRKLLRVGELARRTGVSTSAINYYVREGLLPPPLKTAPNMAYYDPAYVDTISSIRALQREKGMSLSEIKRAFELEGPAVGQGSVFPEDGAATGAAEQIRSLDRREHIMSAAAEVFAEKGYFSSTIADIASAAGVAKGTIYWYFENKRSIMVAVLDDIFEEIALTFRDIMREAPDGLEALLRCVEPAMHLLDRHGAIYLMYFLEIGSTDILIQKKFRDIYRAVHTGARIAVERGKSQGVIRDVDPDIAAYAVMGLVERVGPVRDTESGPVPPEIKAEQVREMVRRALAADP